MKEKIFDGRNFVEISAFEMAVFYDKCGISANSGLCYLLTELIEQSIVIPFEHVNVQTMDTALLLRTMYPEVFIEPLSEGSFLDVTWVRVDAAKWFNTVFINRNRKELLLALVKRFGDRTVSIEVDVSDFPFFVDVELLKS